MKPIYLIPVLAVILLVCAAGCVSVPAVQTVPTASPSAAPTVSPTSSVIVTPVVTATPVPSVTSSAVTTDDKIVGTWKLSKDKTITGKEGIVSYTVTFNSDGTCTETDYWSDGDQSHWVGYWQKTGDGTYLYNTYPRFIVENGVLHTWYDSVKLYGQEKLTGGKWVQKDEDKSIVYHEYLFKSDGTGTQTRLSDINGETQSMDVPITWKKFGSDNVYQIIINGETADYPVQMISDNEIYEPNQKDTLIRV